MMRLGWGVLAGVTALGACSVPQVDVPDWADGSAWDIARVEALTVSEDPYLAALQTGYLEQARSELAQFDWIDGARYLAKSVAAANGTRVPPLEAEDRGIERPEDDPLVQGAQKLKAYIASRGPMLRAARQIGEAQVHYDCWVEQLEEGHQFDDIRDCRELFQGTLQLVIDLADLPDNMAVVLPKDGVVGGIELQDARGRSVLLDQAFAAAGFETQLGDLPVDEGEIRDAFAAALGAAPPPPAVFEVLFDFNSTKLSDEALVTIWQASQEAQRRSGAEILIQGHADAVGTSSTNRAISYSRADGVFRAIEADLPEGHQIEVTLRAVGESNLKIPTQNKEEENRRVVVLVR